MAVTPTLASQFAVGAVALYTLITAAGLAIERSLALARYYAVPDVLIGMTVLAIGTSLPEIGSHVVASLGIASGTLDYRITSAVVLGGNMGSSTAQQTLLFGLFLIAFGRLHLSRSLLRLTYVPMLAALFLTLVVAVDGSVSRLDGLVLLVAYLAYGYYTYVNRPRAYAVREAASENVRLDGLVALGALILVLLAASLLLAVAEVVVGALQLGGSMIGVITLGIAAALPELSTVLDAVRRRAPDVAVGTLLGSNVVNPLVGIGLGGAISTYAVPRAVVVWDLPFKLVVGIGLLVYVTRVSDRSLTRREGGYLVVLYFVFVTTRLLAFPGQ